MLKWKVVKVENWQWNFQTFSHASLLYFMFQLYSDFNFWKMVKPFTSSPILKLHLIVNKQELKNYCTTRKVISPYKQKVNLTGLKKRREMSLIYTGGKSWGWNPTTCPPLEVILGNIHKNLFRAFLYTDLILRPTWY